MHGELCRWASPHETTNGPEPLLERVLSARGLEGEDRAVYLDPVAADLHPADALPGVVAAAERIEQALAGHERIAIYGDYDVDGVTSMAMLMRLLAFMQPEARLEAYVPHRLDEGYGLNATALTALKDRGTDLVITVDCGVTAAAEIAHARELGLDVIITDHHPLDGHEVPDVAAVVHPALPGSSYPWPILSGSAVAWKLLRVLATRHAGGKEMPTPLRRIVRDGLCLAGMGVIADVVPLVGENRILAAKSLALLPHCSIKGVAAMLLECVKPGEPLNSSTVGFRIGPRLNAAGRIGHAQEAFDLLMTDDDDEAKALARRLSAVNTSRQELARQIETEAVALAEASGQTGQGACMIMLANESWHPGVVGIVCSRLVERFDRPTILLGSTDGGVLRGSARSIQGYPINEALAACQSHFTSAGGHAMAAGMSLTTDMFDQAQAAMLAHAQASLTPSDLVRTLMIDCEIQSDDLTLTAARSLSRMEPFGRGNEAPSLLLRGVRVDDAKVMGKGSQHLALQFGGVRGPWFGQGHRIDSIPRGACIDVVGQLQINRWRGRESVEFLIRDLRRH